jgi:PPOX class probable F420-dependent enzyme
MTDLHIPDSHLDLVTAATVALSTLTATGSIQTTAIWVLLDDDGLLRTSLSTNRHKYANLVARPDVTLFAIADGDPFHTLEVRAKAEVTEDPDRAFMAKLIAAYGQSLETMAAQAREERVVVTFRPTRVRAQG